MNDLNHSRNPASRLRTGCSPAITRPNHGPTQGLASLGRLLWAALLLPAAFDAQAGAVFTSLYSFTGTDHGANPYAGLVQGSNGNFYGTALRITNSFE